MSNIVQADSQETPVGEFEKPATTGVFSAGVVREAELVAEPALPFEAFCKMPYREARQEAIATFERVYVHSLLSRCGGNVSQAARLAAMDRVYLHRLMRRHGLRAPKAAINAERLPAQADEPG